MDQNVGSILYNRQTGNYEVWNGSRFVDPSALAAGSIADSDSITQRFEVSREQAEQLYNVHLRGRASNHIMFEEVGDFQPNLGLLEQLPNRSEYRTISYNELNLAVGETFFGIAGNDNDFASLMIHTGSGGMQQFNEAMRDQQWRVDQFYYGADSQGFSVMNRKQEPKTIQGKGFLQMIKIKEVI
jgi:hypothetical protein